MAIAVAPGTGTACGVGSNFGGSPDEFPESAEVWAAHANVGQWPSLMAFRASGSDPPNSAARGIAIRQAIMTRARNTTTAEDCSDTDASLFYKNILVRGFTGISARAQYR